MGGVDAGHPVQTGSSLPVRMFSRTAPPWVQRAALVPIQSSTEFLPKFDCRLLREGVPPCEKVLDRESVAFPLPMHRCAQLVAQAAEEASRDLRV